MLIDDMEAFKKTINPGTAMSVELYRLIFAALIELLKRK